MNHRVVFIIALSLAVLLHSGAGIIMLHDERSRIQSYLQEPEPVIIQLIPEAQMPPENQADSQENDEDSVEEIERTEKVVNDEEDVEKLEEVEENQANQAAQENAEDSQKSDQSPSKKPHKEASYRQNISKGGDLMKENILPPREEGGYSRTVSTEDDPYKKLVENAIALLEDTPFLDKEWQEKPAGEEEPTYYSSEFIDLLKKYNPSEPLHKEEEPESEEPIAPENAELDEFDQFGNPKPVTLIVNQIMPATDLSELEEIAKKKEAEKERIQTTNIINAAGSQIRRLEYNVSLTSSQCYDNYIKGSNRRYSAIVMILEDPKGTGIYRSTGNPQLDSCIIEMTNQFIQIPAEMERIRKNAPRMGNGKGYLLNASF